MGEIELPDDLQEIIDSYWDMLEIYVTDKNNITELHTLRANKTAPKGTGTSFLTQLCKWADSNKRTIVLQTAVKDDKKFAEFKTTSSQSRLVTFYKRFGFISNYSKRDYRSDLIGNMHRNPN